jgi:hypothetical protein
MDTMDEDAIKLLVTRLSRPHKSGGESIDRSSILAEGADSAAVLTWIAEHDGKPEEQVSGAAKGGLHSARLGSNGAAQPRRYILPPGTLNRG